MLGIGTRCWVLGILYQVLGIGYWGSGIGICIDIGICLCLCLCLSERECNVYV